MCDDCDASIIRGGYSCVPCDADYCQTCYAQLLEARIQDDGPTPVSPRRRSPPQRNSPQFSPQQAQQAQRARFEEATSEASSDDATAERAPRNFGAAAERRSPVKRKRRTNVPFNDPSLDPDSDGNPKDETRKGKERKLWHQAVHNHTADVSRVLGLRAGIEPRVMNRIALGMSLEQREQLRNLGFMQQEVYLAKKQVFDQLKAQQYTAEASLDIMHDPQNRLTTRQVCRVLIVELNSRA